MKRVADKQLIKDGRDEDEDEDVGTGFKKADESTLARRQIRGLPKRSLAGTAGTGAVAPPPAGFSWNAAPPAAPAPIASEEAAPVSKFAGFSGFGASSATPAASSLTFGGSSSTTSSFAASSTSPLGSSFSPAAPTTTSGASNSAKMFASFLSGGAPTNGVDNKPTPTPAAAAAVATPSPPTSNEDKYALQYYTSLRGLNTSLVGALNKYIEEDSFADLSVLLEQYKSKRADVQKDYDSKKPAPVKTNGAPAAPPKLNPPSASGSLFAPPSIPSSSVDTKPPALGGGFTFTPKPAGLSSTSSFTLPPSTGSKSSEPKPVLGGISFGGSQGLTAPTPSVSGGFSFAAPPKATNPASPPSSGGFSFGAPAKDTSLPAPSSIGFSFGAPAKDTSSSSALPPPSLGSGVPAKETASGFAFGGPAKDTATSAGFSFGAPSKADASSAPSLPFSLTSSGSSTSKPFPFGSDKPKDEPKEEGEVKPTTSSSGFFGATSNTLSGSSAFGTFGKPTPTSGFSFGSAPSSSIGESKPFGFGASSSTPSVFGSAATSSGFSFGSTAGPTVAKKDDEGDDMKVEAGSTASDSAPGAAMLGVNPHDEEGEGEEDEETVHAIKSKVYRMKKADEKGGPGWVEAGHGVMRLKKHKETGVRRMLLRNSTTGKININFALYSGLAPKQNKKTVTFIGHDNGVSQTYNARVPSEDAARELKEALEREVALIKAKGSE